MLVIERSYRIGTARVESGFATDGRARARHIRRMATYQSIDVIQSVSTFQNVQGGYRDLISFAFLVSRRQRIVHDGRAPFALPVLTVHYPSAAKQRRRGSHTDNVEVGCFILYPMQLQCPNPSGLAISAIFSAMILLPFGVT